MAVKRLASEALEELDVPSPASKRLRSGPPSDEVQTGTNHNGPAKQPATDNLSDAHMSDHNNNDSDDNSDPAPVAPIRQSAPTAGYEDLYLDTINRHVLDFDFEKLCSVSLTNLNVYACLVCGKYYQGRGPKSHAYFHALDEDHHVFINMETHKVYVLPDGYEVTSPSLDDIKYVSDPRYTREHVAQLDRKPHANQDLSGKKYVPGFVGMNNIKENDYLNVVVQALSHVSPMRNFFLLDEVATASGRANLGSLVNGKTVTTRAATSELVKRMSLLIRKIWNPRAFKAHVSPHELLQEIALRSNKRFTLSAQADPADFFSWFLNNLHLALGGSRTRPNSSIVQAIFQGRMKVESQAITAKADASDRLRFEAAAEVKREIVRFMMLTLDLPPPPLFQDDTDRNIIPHVSLQQLLTKYDGRRAQEHHDQRKRYRLLHPLPPFLCFHIKRFTANKFVAERNPTIVVFESKGLNIAPFVEPARLHSEDPDAMDVDDTGASSQEPIYYDLVANIVHEAVRGKDDAGAARGAERKAWKVQLLDKARDEWLVCQDLFVESTNRELLYLGESYLQIWERRRPKIPSSDAVVTT